jgi:hypothetical protein
VQSIDLETEEDLFALTVFKERAISSTAFVEAHWSIILTEKLVSRLAACMQGCWGRARNHDGMERLVAGDSLSLSDDAWLRGIQSPDFETDLNGLEKDQLNSKVGTASPAACTRTYQVGKVVKDLRAIGFRSFNLRGHKLTELLVVVFRAFIEGHALLRAAFLLAFACILSSLRFATRVQDVLGDI